MVEHLSMDIFQAEIEDFERSVLEMKDISTVCTASDWQLAAHAQLHEPREPRIYRQGSTWLLWCMGSIHRFRRVLQPFEMSWAFGCPLVGGTLEERLQLSLEVLIQERPSWEMAIFSGLPEDSEEALWLERTLGARFMCESFEGCHCDQALLHDGLDAWLSRRSRNFRVGLKKSERAAQEQDIQFEWIDGICDGAAVLDRVFRIEERSWKGETGNSIYRSNSYRSFYSDLCRRLGRRGLLRVMFAQHEGKDVAYAYGGILGTVYRGFQISYNDKFSSIGLGNLIQWKQLQKLAEEGITLYDLGMEMGYKKRWADRLQRFQTLVFTRL
ncbi:MAG: GNAT family N-acetyltransferase [Myxococcales bacterium]|nr:GNAT family N-acetyltransferase [Myxococcales bacterium]MCB9643495.1 GNAT family N-acetyltransferase [Myxococcales bacterium]